MYEFRLDTAWYFFNLRLFWGSFWFSYPLLLFVQVPLYAVLEVRYMMLRPMRMSWPTYASRRPNSRGAVCVCVVL